MGLDSLTFNGSAPLNWTATKNVTGASANTNSSSANEAKTTLGTTNANNAAGGADELYFAILSITASGNAQIDLTSFTDILAAAAISAARVKFIEIGLLSTAQDSVNGTAASSVTVDGTVTNGFTSQTSNRGWLANATSGFDIANGSWIQHGCPNANGILVDSTHKVVKITNNDAGVTAKVKMTICVGTT